jgi:hypothetical protein
MPLAHTSISPVAAASSALFNGVIVSDITARGSFV